MVKRYQRTYEQYERLGRELKAVREQLSATFLYMANEMYGKTHRHTQQMHRLCERLDTIRSELDSTYFVEGVDKDQPEGTPVFPLYPGSKRD